MFGDFKEGRNKKANLTQHKHVRGLRNGKISLSLYHLVQDATPYKKDIETFNAESDLLLHQPFFWSNIKGDFSRPWASFRRKHFSSGHCSIDWLWAAFGNLSLKINENIIIVRNILIVLWMQFHIFVISCLNGVIQAVLVCFPFFLEGKQYLVPSCFMTCVIYCVINKLSKLLPPDSSQILMTHRGSVQDILLSAMS